MKIVVIAFAALGLAGCVSGSVYQEKETELDSYKRRLVDEQGRASALDAKVKDLESRLKDADSQKSASTASHGALEGKVRGLESALSQKDSDQKTLEAKIAELNTKLEELTRAAEEAGKGKKKK